MTTAQIQHYENYGQPEPIVAAFDQLGILPHSLPNAIGMWPNEQECLVWSALQCNPDENWWEVGSFCGGSTILLGFAQESLDGKGHIISVDPAPRPIMDLNIKRAKLNNRVSRCKTTSAEALSKNDSPISFLFLDGWHSFSAVLSEFEAAKPYLTDDAVVAFHDVSPVLKECDDSYIEEKMDYVKAHWDSLMRSTIQDFRIDEAVIWICATYGYEILDIPVRKHIAYYKETGLTLWMRGRTSPYNSFIAIRKSK
jgi:predicted O-methyltransferase YrrM